MAMITKATIAPKAIEISSDERSKATLPHPTKTMLKVPHASMLPRFHIVPTKSIQNIILPHPLDRSIKTHNPWGVYGAEG